jgi:hypothetical protein
MPEKRAGHRRTAAHELARVLDAIGDADVHVRADREASRARPPRRARLGLAHLRGDPLGSAPTPSVRPLGVVRRHLRSRADRARDVDGHLGQSARA